MSPPTEHTLLLPGSASLENNPRLPGEAILDASIDQECMPKRTLVANEFWILFCGSIPIILAYALQNSIQALAVVIIGRHSPEDLSTAAFSFMFAASTGWLIGMGGTTALDTLASSTFTGSKDKYDLGVLLQRAFVILTLFYIPIALLWAFSEPIFLALGQTPRLSHDSAKFLTNLIPAGLGYTYFEIMKKYLQAQGIMRSGTCVLLLTCPISAILNYVFIYVADWGIFSAPFAVGISYWLSFLGLVLYSKYISGSEHWGGWSHRCLQNTGIFTKLAILGLIQMGTEWWAFELITIVAGQLGEIPLASQSVIMTADQITSTIPFGIGVAASVRLGNVLGARDPTGARRSVYTAVALGQVAGVLLFVLLLSTRNVFARMFNDDVRVVEGVAEIIPFVALIQIADALHGTCGGALRGMGMQDIGAVVNFVAYYCVSLPLGFYLAFHGWGLRGIWVGQCTAMFSVSVAEFVIVACTDWPAQIAKAFGRMDGDHDFHDESECARQLES